MTRTHAVLAAFALLGAAACSEAKADVEPLPPLHRPTPEERAGLPVLSGRWAFTGFEYPARDTLRVREQVYRLVPPGEFRVTTQRLDSVAGQYVRDSVAFPFTGEVRRDGIFAFVATEPGGAGQFVSGHVTKDTLWIELTGFPSAAGWPPGTRAALVRNPRGAPFTRLSGYIPPPPPPVDSTRPAAAPQPVEAAPTAAPQPVIPVEPRPQPAPPTAPPLYPQAPPETVRMPPIDTFRPVSPPVQQPRPRPRPIEPAPPPPPPQPDTALQFPQMPRDTIRMGAPPPR